MAQPMDDENTQAQADLADGLTAEIVALVQAIAPTAGVGLLVLANAASQIAYRSGKDKAALLEALDSTYDLVAAKLGATKGQN